MARTKFAPELLKLIKSKAEYRITLYKDTGVVKYLITGVNAFTKKEQAELRKKSGIGSNAELSSMLLITNGDGKQYAVPLSEIAAHACQRLIEEGNWYSTNEEDKDYNAFFISEEDRKQVEYYYKSRDYILGEKPRDADEIDSGKVVLPNELRTVDIENHESSRYGRLVVNEKYYIDAGEVIMAFYNNKLKEFYQIVTDIILTKNKAETEKLLEDGVRIDREKLVYLFSKRYKSLLKYLSKNVKIYCQS